MRPRRCARLRPATGVSSIVLALLVDVVVVLVVVVLVLVLVPVVLVLVLVGVLVIGFRPALGLLDLLEIHLVPGLEIDLLDFAVEILDLYELRVLVDRQNAERILFF